MPNKYWLKTLFFLWALACFGTIDAQVRFKVALSSDSTRYQVSLFSETGPFSQPSDNIFSSATITLIAPTGQLTPTAISNQIGFWSGPNTFINPVGELNRDYFVFTLNNPNSDIVFTPGLEVNLFSFANNLSCAGAVELMDNDNDPFLLQDPNVNIGSQITIVNFGQVNAYSGAFQPGSANCMGAPACDLTISNVSETAITSCGGNNGSIIIEAANATGTLLYSIDNGITWSSTGTFSNLGIGNYTIKVKDDICEVTSDSNPVAIAEPGITVQVTDSIPATCNNSVDGQITIVASGGLPPYEYSINNGANWTSNGTFAGLGNGVFIIKARNADSTCETTHANSIVFSTQGINVEVDKTDISCTTGANGTIDISAAGGIGIFNYSIDSGQTWLATSDFSDLASGNYYVFVRNSNGNCESAYINNPVVINENAVNYTVTSIDPPCTGGALGSIELVLNGETGTFEYSIDNGISWLSNPIFSNLDTGTYQIVVRTEGGGCESPFVNNPVTLSIAPINISVTTIAGGCENDMTNRIIVSTSGGDGIFEYSIDDGTTWQTSNIFENLANNDYQLKVRNIDGSCETAYALNPISFTGSAINIGISTIAPSCNDALDGSINISANGGNGNYIYSIDDGANFTNLSAFIGLGNGMYTIKVRNADGTCETTYSNNPVQFNTPALALVASSTETSCATATDGTISMLGNGGTGNFEFSIDSGLTWSTTANYQNLAAAVYYLQIRNANGTCPTAYSNNPVDLRSDTLDLSLVSNTPPSCENDNDGSLILTATGGISTSYEFSIDDGLTWQNVGTFQNLSSGTYQLKARLAGTDCVVSYANNPVLVENTSCPAPDPVPIDTCLLTYILSETNGIYTIALKTDTTWTGNAAATSNAQVSIRVPTGGFQVGNISNKISGAVFANTGTSNNPTVATGFDFFAFNLQAITTAIPYNKGDTVDLFSFENVGTCISGTMHLIGDGAIPEPNINNINFDAQITVAGWGNPDAPVCSAGNSVSICEPASTPDCVINVVLNNQENVFTLGMIPDTTWVAPLNTVNSAQFTLRIPSNGYELENFQNIINGAVFEVTSRQNSPSIENGYDYLSVTLSSFGTTAIPFTKGVQTNLFSFEINDACAADSIFLVGEGSTFSFPNGESDNLASQMTVLGWTMADVPLCVQTEAQPICNFGIELVLQSDASHCGASDGTLAIGTICTGTTTQYSVDNGVTYQSSSEFNNLSAGDYFVKIRNEATNCELSYDLNPIRVADGLPISFTASSMNPTCADSTNGAITLSASNGSGNYLYSIDDGITWRTTPTFLHLANGSYLPKVSNLDTTCITAFDEVTLVLSAISCSQDSDGDGQPDVTEDLNMDGNLENDDTDGDTIPNYRDNDDDGDGVLTRLEQIGPNQGDGNGDGNPDCLQSNVASIQDEQDAFRTLEVTGDACQMISEFSIQSEGSMGEFDPNYDFPFQLNAFTIPCGGTVTINLYFHNVTDLSAFDYRKYGPTIPGGTITGWYDFPATITQDTIGGLIIGKVTFQLTDGEIGDATGVDNMIVDPGGVAMNVNNAGDCLIVYDLEKVGETYSVSLTSDTSLAVGANLVDSAKITLRAPTGVLDVINFTNEDINVLFELDTTYIAPVEAPNYDYFVFQLSAASQGTNNVNIFQDLKEPLFSFENGGICSFDSLFLVGTNAPFTTPIIGGEDLSSAITLSGWEAPTCVTNTGGLFCLPSPRDTLAIMMFEGLVNNVCLTNTIQLPNGVGSGTVLFQGTAVSGGMLSDTCIQLLSQANFVGRDFVTLVFCDAVNTNICDTTVLDITVNAQPTCLINFFIEDSMGVFQCKMVSDTTWDEPLNEVISAQFTIRTPTGSFEINNLQNGIGMVDFDLQTMTTIGNSDYLNIVLQTLNTQDIPFQKGDTVCLFSFENSRFCTSDSLFLVGEGSPIAATDVGDEPIFSKLAVQGWGGGVQSVPACVMNYGLPICPIIAPKTDTIHLVMAENETISVCVDSVLELLNIVGTASICSQGMNINAVVADNDSCVTVQAPANFVGNDTICVFHSDIAELDFRDTTYLIITVDEKPFAPTDTVIFTINDTMEVCIGAALQLNTIGAATILSTGDQTNVSLNNNEDCLTLLPADGFVGNDTLQVIHCDANNPTFCDTTIIVVTIEAPPVCLFEYLIETREDRYTIRLVVGTDVPSNGLNSTLSMLTAIRVPAFGFNVPTDSITTLLSGTAFENTSNGVLLDEEEPNYGYILFDIVGNVAPIYQAGDTLDLFSFRGTNCVEDVIRLVGPGATFPNPIINTVEITSFLSIGAFLPTGGTPYCVSPIGGTSNCNSVIIPDPAPQDTVHYVLDFETPTTVCIDSALQLLNTVGSAAICEQGTNVMGSVTNGDSCVLLTLATNFSGNDTLCVVHCDAVMTDFCDTTILVITVNPNDATPPPAVPDTTCAIQFDLRLTDGVYVVSMTSDTTIRNTTFPFPNAPNPFSPAPTNLMEITLRAPTGQLQITSLESELTSGVFVLTNSFISSADDPANDYFIFSYDPGNIDPPTSIPYNAGQATDLFSFQNTSCNLEHISLIGRGTTFDDLVIGGVNINTHVIANSDTIPACVEDTNIIPAMLAFSTTNTAPTTGICNDGSITITATGGTGLFEYSINNGVDWFITNEFTNLENGTYLVRVRSTDEVCLSDAETIVLQNTNCAPICMIAITSVDSINATCSEANGRLTVNATGTNLQYSINTGATFQSSNVFENVAAGTYNIVVRDSVETTCEANITATLSGTTLPEIQSVNITADNTFAGGQGIISIFATSASSGRRYSIDGGQTFFEGNAFTNLGLGTYTIVVANDDESCPVQYSNNPIQIDQPCSVDAGEDRTICSGTAVSLSANGPAPIFGWVPSTGLSCTDCPNPIATPDITTTYVVTNSGGGCFVMDTIIVTVLPTITADFNFTANCADLSVQFMDSSSTIGTITTYAWDFGDGTGVSTVANPNYTYAVAGTYTVQLMTTIEGDCTNTVSKLVEVGNGLTGMLSADTSICTGDCAQLIASGGTTYTWLPADGLSATDIANPMACPTETTTYFVTISNDMGCSTMDSVTVTITNPTIGVSATESTCGGNNGVITIFASLPGETLEFQLIDNDEWFLGNSFTNLAPGEYNVSVRTIDAACVTAFPNNPVVINEMPGPVIDSITANSPTDCSVANGNITIAASGANPLIYTIDGGINWSAFNDFTGLGQGSYIIQVAFSDTTCITESQTVQLNAPTAPIITSITTMNPEGCGLNTGLITIVAISIIDLEYSIDNGDTWQINNSFSDLATGMYPILVRHIDGTCVTPLDSIITLNASGAIVIQEVNAVSPTGCADNNGRLEIIADGGVNLEYSIDGGATYQTNNIFDSLSTDVYTIVVRTADESCQTAYDDPIFLIGDFELLITAVDAKNPTGCGINDGNIIITATGGDNLVYSIDNGDTFQASNIFENLPAGIYTIIVRTTDDLCQSIFDTPVILMGEGDLMITNVASANPTNCGGTDGTITITAAGPSNLEYSIDNGVIWQASNVFNNLSAGTYTIQVRTIDLLCQVAYDTPVVLMGSGDLTITEVAISNPDDCGGINGSITITATGPNDLEYSIDNGVIWQTSNVFNDLPAGDYMVLVRTTDLPCQTAYDRLVTLIGRQEITILDVFSLNPSDIESTDGIIEILATGNDTLEYSIDNGDTWQTSPLFENIGEGVYTILVRYTDDNCQVSHILPIVLTAERCLVFIDVIAQSPLGCGSNDGHIVIITNTIENVEYSINNGIDWQDFEIFENLGPGEYTVLVRRTDIDCQIALDSTITLGAGDDLMILQVDIIDRDVCNNFGGEIFINTNLFNNIEFSINNGIDWQLAPFFNNVDTGTYTVLARSLDLSCQVAYEFPVRVNAVQNAAILNVLVNNPTNCNSTNGSILIEANVGFNAEFSIDNGITWQSNPQFTNLPSGTYNIKLRTGNCEVDYMNNPVILGAPNDFSIVTPIPNMAICTDTLMAISVTLSDLIDSYQVNSGAIANAVLTGTTLTFDAIVTGLFNEYELTFTNAIGCEVTESFTIFQATDTEADFVVIEPHCKEMEVNLLFTGTATPMADLIWELDGGVLVSSSPATATEPAGKEIVVRWDSEGSRLIKLTVNDGGCIDDEYESIFVRKLPLVDAGADASICMDGCVELTGSGTGVWYEWSPAIGLSSTDGPRVTACPTETTTYTLTVMSADGCISTDEVTVNVETGFVIMTEDVTICEGESTQLSASGGMNYTWFPDATLDNPNIATPIATPAVTTLYKVVTANQNGCIDTAYVTVFVNPNPEAIACEDKTICSGDSIQLIVTTHAQYSWSPTNTLINPTSGTPIAFPTQTTTYTVRVTDENGCTDTDEVIVFVNTPPTVNAGNDVTICANASTRLNAAGAISYTWSPTAGLSNPNIANPIVNPSNTTTYTVTGTDINGCTNTDQITVFVMESTGISTGNDVTICEGNIVQLNAIGGSNYVWSPAIGLNNPNIANPIATPTATTTYTVTGVSTNGCPAIDTVTIFVTPRPEVIACEDKTICRGESVQLIATTHAQYSWSPTNTLLNPTSGTPTAFPTETTTYTVTVTDENGCTDTDEVVVFVNDPIRVNLGPDITLCGAGTAPLDAGEGIAYQWSPIIGLSNPNIRNPIATVSNTTTYSVQVTNANACVETDDITININNGPIADAGPSVTLCPGGSGQLTASGGVAYQWSPTTGLSNPNIANPIVTTDRVTNYRVTVTDEFGCTATDETLVTVSLPLAIDPIITDATCCGAGGSAILNVSGGFGNADFSWSPNVSTSNTATNLAAGFYKVIVSDAVGCSIIFTFDIKEDCNGCPDMFPENERCIPDTSTTEQICVPIALEDIDRYEILVDGNNYVPDHGCAHENLTAYSYALVEGQGNTGMYRIENWEVNGQMYATEVETMQELTFWMNTIDPSGNWINHPSILTIIGGNPTNNYGTMKVIQLTKWIETMLQPDVTGIATSSIIEVEVNTMIRPIEVIITDTATCCSDTILLKRCGEEQPCVEDIIAQNQFDESIDCGETATICLDIPFTAINNYELVANNSPFTGAILPCNFDSMFAYTYFTLPGQGAAGPYKITNWIIDGQMNSGMFNDLEEFVQLMNQIDPTGNWQLDQATLTIQGGNAMTDYGAINVEQTTTGSIATLEINSNLIPMGTELTFASGNFEVLINNINSGCRDRFLVNVMCDNIEPPTDTMVTPPTDTMVTPPTDTMVTPPTDTMVTPPTDTMDGHDGYTSNGHDGYTSNRYNDGRNLYRFYHRGDPICYGESL